MVFCTGWTSWGKCGGTDKLFYTDIATVKYVPNAFQGFPHENSESQVC